MCSVSRLGFYFCLFVGEIVIFFLPFFSKQASSVLKPNNAFPDNYQIIRVTVSQAILLQRPTVCFFPKRLIQSSFDLCVCIHDGEYLSFWMNSVKIIHRNHNI